MLSLSVSHAETEVHAVRTTVATTAVHVVTTTVVHAAMTEVHAVHVVSVLQSHTSRTTNQKCSNQNIRIRAADQ
jgi:hypothetical protein